MKYIEDELTELKEIYVEDVKKEIIAFANTKGGRVIIGVNDDGEVVGLTNPTNVELQVLNAIRDSIRPDLTQFVDIQTKESDGKKIVVVDIQRGSNRPYYLSNKGLRPTGVYVRQSSSSFPASENMIKELIKKSDNYSYENSYSFNQDLTFDYTSNYFKKREIQFNKTNMKTLGLINQEGYYTNLGLLMSDQCPHIIKVAKFLDDKFTFHDRREFYGSLLKQLDDAYSYLELCNNTRSVIKGLYRDDKIDYPEVALRESLLNSIVHRNYSSSSATLINIFNDKIIIKNNGTLNEDVELDDIIHGYSSLRNPKLANIFYRLELIEAYGTGIIKIIKSYEQTKYEPKFETTSNLFVVTLPNINEYNENFNNHQKDDIAKYIEDNDFVSRYDLQARFQESASTIVRRLRKLKEDGYIESVGSGKNTKYRIKK